MKSLKDKILFIKPFEIDSSYTSFVIIWKNIKKVLSRAEGIHQYALIRSVDYSARFGFISFSAWDSKISFSNAVKDNTVLKYHISKNGEGKESDYLFLYKVLKQNQVRISKSGDEFLFIDFIKDENNSDNGIIKYWNEINEYLKSKKIARNSYLCKSVYQFSKFRYIILMSIKNCGIADLFSEYLVIKDKSNQFGINDYYSSIYSRNLKLNNIQTINFSN